MSSTQRLDSRAKATLCTDCGGWPATFRPNGRQAYCESCQEHHKE